jgi:eukaryotic-like serine/threonine-protein kinase
MSGLDESSGEFTGTTRFELLRCIGAGGIGLVYEAVDREDGSRVAIKTLQRLDSDALLRFKNEFRLLQGLHHRNLVGLGELFEHHGQWFFTMELLDGTDFMAYVAPRTSAFRQLQGAATDSSLDLAEDTARLSQITPRWREIHQIERQRLEAATTMPGHEGRAALAVAVARAFPGHSFDEGRLRAALCQLTEGLIALHEAGKVHRDIKPQNVMVAHDRVVLLDFGLVSEDRGEAAVERGMVLGTPGYMSPEQAAGQSTTPASDWYGVGVMLYEALVGRRPFEGSSAQVMLAKQSGDPAPPLSLSPSVPRDLDQLCMDLLCRAPEARPGGREVLSRLRGPQDPEDPDSGRVPRVMSETASSEHTRLVNVPLIGREALLDHLERAFDERGHGRPVAVFVHGNSGMGKTALVETFTGTLRERSMDGCLILRGKCYERESVPYKAFDGIVDALARYLKRPDVGAEFLVPHRIDTLVRLFPVLQGVRRPVGLPSAATGARDPQELRHEAFGALKELFGRIASKWPLVVLIDDLQWGDLDSAALLTELLSPPSAPGMLFIASYRSEEHDTPLLVALRDNVTRAVSQRRIHEIDVGPLAEADSKRLAAASLNELTGEPGARTEELADAVARESAGSPFFVGELVRHLVMTGAYQGGDQPRGVALDDVLRSRRERLSEDARAVLDMVAVAGRPLAQGVALSALDLDAKLRPVFDELRAERLVRTRGPGRQDTVECYHDRIREAVVAGLGQGELERKHRQLAAALEKAGSSDAAMLAGCYLGAGEPARAAEYAIAAARKAEQALAFDRAAHMYRLALDIGPGAAGDERALRVSLGEALANAGRGGEAAAEFLAAAEIAEADAGTVAGAPAAEGSVAPRRADAGSVTGAPAAEGSVAPRHADAGSVAGAPAAEGSVAPRRADAGSVNDALDLRRRAAEQLLRSGRIDEGLVLLGDILAGSKLHVPRTDHGALMSLALHRVRLRLRGLDYQPRPPEEVSARARQRVDLCWAGTVGLGMVDPVRGADFGTRCLLMALDTGDEARIARTLAMEAGQVATGGGKTAARAEALADRAAEIARRIDDPQALGLALLGSGAAALLSGRWRTAYDEFRRGEAILRERCTGVTWEMTTLRTLQLAALYYLGEWSSMHELAAVALRQALERADLYMVASMVSYATFARLADDDVDGARLTIRNATVKWSLRGYHVQRYFNLMSHLYVDLYEDEGAKAWHRLQQEWPTMSRSLLLRVQLLRIEMAHGRARCALALAQKLGDPAQSDAETAPGQSAESLLRVAASDARRIERERMPWALPLAGLVRAALAAGRGQSERAATMLEAALTAFQDADMHLFAAAARYRLGEVVGGERGQELVAEAGASMRKQGIANPARVVAALAPGFPRPS